MNSTNNRAESENTLTVCMWCGTPSAIIWIHGHGQCANCGTNIDECCRGERCDTGIQESSILNKDETNE